MLSNSKLVLFISTSFALAGPAFAQTPVMDLDWGLTPGQTQADAIGDTDGDQSAESKAKSKEPVLDLGLYFAVEDKAVFLDQGLTVTTKPSLVINPTVGYDGWLVDVWARRSLVGRRCDNETDLAISKDIAAGPVTITPRYNHIAICGRNANSLKVTAKMDLGNGFNGNVSAERIRDGFVENVLRGQLGYSDKFDRKRGSFNLSLAGARSTYIGGITLSGNASASHKIGSGWSLGGFAKGYKGLTGPRRSDIAFGLTFTR